MTGEELRALREQRGLSRPALAALAAVHPDTVRYWERKVTVDLRGFAPKLLLRAMGLDRFLQTNLPPGSLSHRGNSPAYARARGEVLENAPQFDVMTVYTMQCCARTRSGNACRANAIPGKTRCRFHGGLSSGPKTPEGRKRIAEAQRKRWARWRAERK